MALPLTAPNSPHTCLSHSSWSGGAPEIEIENISGIQAKSSAQNSTKRKSALTNNDDEFDVFTPSSSRARAPKRQCLQQSAPKARATPKSKVVVKAEDDNRLEPRGQPEVWAEVPSISPFLPVYC